MGEVVIEETSQRQSVMHKILALPTAVAVITLVLIAATTARAQSFTVLYKFCTQATCTSGESPTSLIQATDGAFYGTTTTGGTNNSADCPDTTALPGCGTVFKITARGALTTLHDFCSQRNCPDGGLPDAALLQAIDGDYYGTLSHGGNVVANYCSGGCGAIFKITPGGQATTLYDLCSQPNCTDGALPDAALIRATDGNFYGTTENGGGTANCLAFGILGCGTLFKITPDGVLTTLYTFCTLPNCTDGASPRAALIQATNGDFYGTTAFGGGANDTCGLGCGIVFKITPSGKLTTLYSFCSQPNCADGARPNFPLIQASDGNFFGTTPSGGNSLTDNGQSGSGTVFEMTPSGALTTLYSFCSQPNCTDGAEPQALIQASDGNFYGTSLHGGSEDYGTIFELASSGALTTLHDFCGLPNCKLGEGPYSLVQATNGRLYGTTTKGGDRYNGGIIFSLNLGLGPFVALQTNSGEVGAKVTILGTDLVGASTVTFNGTAATFTINSTGTALTTTVPTGATTGTVQVVTPNGTLNSNVAYTVDYP
jgi:uncharacterized repeat protein (TIGR03803 family)